MAQDTTRAYEQHQAKLTDDLLREFMKEAKGLKGLKNRFTNPRSTKGRW